MAQYSLEEINQELENNLKEMFENEGFQNLLRFMSSGHSYSANNIARILNQNPRATMVKSFADWQKTGRNVNNGEKSLKILVPMFKKMEVIQKDSDNKPIIKSGEVLTEIERVIVGFKEGSVFDVSQTNGKEIPMARDYIQDELKSVENVEELYKGFLDYINDSNKRGLTASEEYHSGESYGGYFSRPDNKIVLNVAVSETPEQKFSTLIHEYCHSQIHHMESNLKNLPRGHKEAQAEATAFVVSSYFGFDTSDQSLGYIATWAKDLNLAKQAIGEIQEVSQVIIDEINSLQQDKINEFYRESNIGKVKEKIEERFDIFLNQNPNIQVADLTNGFVLNGAFEEDLKNGNLYFRTNKNRIISLMDLDEKYYPLSVIKDGEHFTEVDNKIEDYLSVHQIEEQKYAIAYMNEESEERLFGTNEEASRFIKRLGLSQSLNLEQFYNKEDSGELTTSRHEKTLQNRIASYLNKDNFHADHEGNIAIGWHLIKNPKIHSVNDLTHDINNLKPNLKSTKRLKSSLEKCSKNKEVKIHEFSY